MQMFICYDGYALKAMRGLRTALRLASGARAATLRQAVSGNGTGGEGFP